MPYQILTLGQFIDQLSNRLDDPTNVFFSREELLDYTTEALRTWGAFTGYWVRRAGFIPNTATKDHFLPPLVNYQQGISTIYPMALSQLDRNLVNSICYSLLEPPITAWNLPWPGTEQYDLPVLVTALQHAVNALQQATSFITQGDSQIVSPTPINQYDIADDAINLRSVYWAIPPIPPATTHFQYPLARQDQYIRGLVADPGATPDSYSLVGTAPRRIEMSPAPTDNGTLHYIKVLANLDLAPTITVAGNSIYLPGNFTWAAKYYALFTLLNAEGERRDKFRADYCMMRLKDAIVLSRVFPGLMRCYINDVECQVSAAWDMDALEPNWRNQLDTTDGAPSSIILHSWSTISLHPFPTQDYSVTFDLAADAPVPASEAEYLDLASEHVQTLLDLAHHLACFKLGGQEFVDTLPSYQRFLLQAIAFNKKLQAESNNFELLKEKSDFQRRRKPVHLDEEDQPDK